MTQPPSKATLAAHNYHEYMVPAMFDPWSERLVALADLQPGERVLDVACGTGVVARRATHMVGASGQVSALDLNPAMLDIARQQPTTPAAPISWVQGSAQSLPYADASFDVVLCQHGLQYIPDRAQALSEMRRVLVPGGRLVVTIWQSLERNPLFWSLNEAALRLVGLPAYSAPFSLGEAGLLDSLLKEAGFRQIEVTQQTGEARFADPEHFVARNLLASAAAIPAIAALDDGEREELAQRMKADMGDTLISQDGLLKAPLRGWFGRAWR